MQGKGLSEEVFTKGFLDDLRAVLGYTIRNPGILLIDDAPFHKIKEIRSFISEGLLIFILTGGKSLFCNTTYQTEILPDTKQETRRLMGGLGTAAKNFPVKVAEMVAEAVSVRVTDDIIIGTFEFQGISPPGLQQLIQRFWCIVKAIQPEDGQEAVDEEQQAQFDKVRVLIEIVTTICWQRSVP